MSVDTINSSSTSSLYDTSQVSETATTAANQTSGNTTVMSSTSGKTTSSSSASTDNDLPNLSTPTTTSTGFSGLSLESLVTAIGNTESKQACAEGVERMEWRADKINENNQLKLDEMADNMETMKKQEKVGKFTEAFQWIGAILGAVAAVASIAVGVLTANPLLIAGGVMGVGMAVDNIVSVATGGEQSMMQGIAKGLEKLGASEDAAYWTAFAVNLIVTAITVGLSVGGAVRGIASGVDAAAKAMSVTKQVQCVVQLASSLNTVASASAGMASAAYDYQLAKSQAEQVDIEAVLEQIRMAQELEEAMIQAQMERSNDLLTSVNDIVEEANSTAMTIMTSAPAMV
ncbi:MAG: type III secretion system translocon subunit SctE [Pseudomonadota bacterium]